MKKLIFQVIMFVSLSAFQLKAQDYKLTFQNENGLNPDSVLVENLITKEKKTLKGTDILHLSETVTSIIQYNQTRHSPKIFPNPISHEGILEFYNTAEGVVDVTALNMSGQELISHKCFLTSGMQKYILSGFSSGCYLISINSPNFQVTQVMLSNVLGIGEPSISFVGTSSEIGKELQKSAKLKSSSATVEMLYSDGEKIRLIAYTGNQFTSHEIIPAVDVKIVFSYEDNLVIDLDGNLYKTITIGNQTWMTENLSVSKYPNGKDIPHITNNSEWANLQDNNTDDAYCFYNNNPDLGYGALYTWAAAMNGNTYLTNVSVQGVCPSGWHLPSDEEWKELEKELGMNAVVADEIAWRGTDQGSQLAGKADLWDNGVLVQNSSFGKSGFDALPSGNRSESTGSFLYAGGYCYWWSSTKYFSGGKSYARSLSYDYTKIYRKEKNRSQGVSVRCVKD